MIKEETKLISEFYELKVEQVMDKKIWDLPIIEKTVPISYILSILDGKSHVWIVNDLEDKELVGIITRHDVLYTLAPPRKYYAFFTVPESCCHYGTLGQAEDIMKRDPITCEKDEKIVDVLQKMIRHRIRRLAVVEKNKLVGEITLKYLIQKFYKASQYYPLVDENIKPNLISDLQEFIKKEKIDIKLSKDSNTDFWLDTPDNSITVRFVIDIKSKQIYYDVYSTEFEMHLKEKTLKDVEKLEFIAEEHRRWKVAEYIENIWLIIDEVEIWAEKNDFDIKEKELV